MLDLLFTYFTPIELAATLFGLASVILTVRQNIWCWPAGLVMVTLYLFIFYDARLYSDAGLQFIYIFVQFYGWYHWARGGPKNADLPVSKLAAPRLGSWVAVALVGTLGLGLVMSTYTDAELAYWDASTTIMSLIATWLMARKVLASWYFWIAVDVLAIGIYTVKELYLTAGLYAVFLGLAITGYFAWRRSLNNN